MFDIKQIKKEAYQEAINELKAEYSNNPEFLRKLEVLEKKGIN